LHDHHVPRIRSQSYVYKAFKREPYILDVNHEAITREVSKADVHANEEDVQVDTILDLFP